MSKSYIKKHFLDILKHENDISANELIAENKCNLQLCKDYGLNYILIDKDYEGDLCTHLTKFIKIT